MVGADDEPVDADLSREVAKRLGREDERVEVHLRRYSVGRFFSRTPVSMSGATRRELSERAAYEGR